MSISYLHTWSIMLIICMIVIRAEIQRKDRVHMIHTNVQVGSEQEELILLLLKKSRWYAGRKIDISSYEAYCKEQGIDLFPAAVTFLQEFSGIDPIVHFKYYYDHMEQPTSESGWHEYEFNFIPNAVAELECEAEMFAIAKIAQEDLFCLGLSGYYYSAVTAIGRSGKLYLLHDYEPQVRVFSTLLESMMHEVGHHSIIKSSLLQSNQIEVRTLNGLEMSPGVVKNPFLI
ncbi:hypothetical protein D3C77_397230 [compost metagenome]